MKRQLSLLLAVLAVASVTIAKDLNQLRQEFRDLRFGMFIHFNMGTYHEKEWVEPGQDPMSFNPTKLDPRGWAKAARSAGMRYAVLTTKHHDGFCLWDTEVTDYDVASTPAKRHDIVKEFADGCRKEGIVPCIYFSIWDRTLGIEDEITHDDIVRIKKQLTELLTNYGDFALIIFDGWGNCGTKWKQQDCDEIYGHVKSLQPDILIMDHYQLRRGLTYEQVYQVEDILHFEEPVGEWVPEGNKYVAQQSPTLQSAWFWKTYCPQEELMSVDDIVNRHIRVLDTRNCNFLLNCAPNREGRMDDNVLKRLKEVGKALKAERKRRGTTDPADTKR